MRSASIQAQAGNIPTDEKIPRPILFAGSTVPILQGQRKDETTTNENDKKYQICFLNWMELERLFLRESML